MTVQAHFIVGPCPYCGLTLARSPKSVAKPVVFCASCFAGGDLEKVTKGGEPLTPSFLTEAQVMNLLSEMGTTREEVRNSR